jgi:SAM-dependent methyltransferase
MNATAQPSCPNCASYELDLLGKLPDSNWFAGKLLEKSLSGGVLYRCHQCQLKFRYPVHDTVIYKQLYDNATVSTWPVDIPRPDWDLIVDHILNRLPKGGRVLDFGCYTGGLLGRLNSIYERYGIEINKTAATIATDKLHVQVWQSIEDIPGELRFDVVIASDVVEHVPAPGRLIDKLVGLLADDGILIITTGDAENSLWNRFGANWWYCFYPEHISFISTSWLDYFLRARWLSIECCEKFRHCRRSGVRLFIATLLAHLYGRFPSAFLRLCNELRHMLGRADLTSVPGNGISDDHLFVVLGRKEMPREC